MVEDAGLALVLAALVLFAPSCSSAPSVDSCAADPSPTLVVDTSEVPTGILSSSGACTPVKCAQSGGTGTCSLWVGDFDAPTVGNTCVLKLDFPQGGELRQTAKTGSSCGGPDRVSVKFAM